MTNESSILITGGTGSLGKALIEELLANKSVRRIAIFSRDELKQSQLRESYQNEDRLRWFLGDIRDLSRLTGLTWCGFCYSRSSIEAS